MERGIVVSRKLHGRHIELDEQVDDLDGEPARIRSKDEIDRQLADDRAGWNGRG